MNLYKTIMRTCQKQNNLSLEVNAFVLSVNSAGGNQFNTTTEVAVSSTM